MTPADTHVATRTRLLAAAREVVHRQGFRTTTIADVANAAGVPLGNVYYHFRTKDDLGLTLIAEHRAELEASFAQWEGSFDTPEKRLRALVASVREMRDDVARWGCPRGSLCQELEKGEGPLAEAASGLLRAQVDFAARQFRALGHGARSRTLAYDLIASLQGASLLAQALRSPDALASALRRIEEGLSSLA
jgi:AcrR family transcriptional regulator